MKIVSRRLTQVLAVFAILSLTFGCSVKKKTDNETKTGLKTTGAQDKTTTTTIQQQPIDETVRTGGGIIEPLPPDGGEIWVEATGELAKIFKNVYFDYDRCDIKNQYRPVLQEVSTWLKENGTVNIMIEGHCDERGTSEYNVALGERRGLSVRRYLISLGVLPSRITTTSYGEDKPEDIEHSEAAWAKNRRAHFLISKNR
ncbi:MAG: peptidoglycan-associated lipoprotein Pal [bacterium]